jgi:hypothetical protein
MKNEKGLIGYYKKKEPRALVFVVHLRKDSSILVRLIYFIG